MESTTNIQSHGRNMVDMPMPTMATTNPRIISVLILVMFFTVPLFYMVGGISPARGMLTRP